MASSIFFWDFFYCLLGIVMDENFTSYRVFKFSIIYTYSPLFFCFHGKLKRRKWEASDGRVEHQFEAIILCYVLFMFTIS